MSEVTPENCPEPYWHKTHRYCPVCSWTEQPEPLKAGDRVWIPAVVSSAPEFPDTYIPVTVSTYVGPAALAPHRDREPRGLAIPSEDIKRE